MATDRVHGTTPDDAEVYACTHWLVHRLAARGLTAYAEATLLADEWACHGGLPAGAAAAIQRGDDDLTPWCGILSGQFGQC